MKKKIKVMVGCSGFYNRHWKGIFYPEKLAQSKWLNFYAEAFNTLELNSTFYKFPTAKGLDAWFNKSPDNFIFSVKAPKLITHYNKFNNCTRYLDDFYLACEEGLKHKLGPVLFQLPPGIHYSEEKLEQIVESLRPAFINVIEFRHKSWWKQKVYDRLSERNIIFCSISHPTLPETIIANSTVAYIRLHGKEKMFYSDYSNHSLEKLRDAILKKTKIKEVYIYFNNTAGTSGVLNAKQMQLLFS